MCTKMAVNVERAAEIRPKWNQIHQGNVWYNALTWLLVYFSARQTETFNVAQKSKKKEEENTNSYLTLLFHILSTFGALLIISILV
jgi:hypothetical protein